jgi:hypothetical protein
LGGDRQEDPVFGNHDEENGDVMAEQFRMMSSEVRRISTVWAITSSRSGVQIGASDALDRWINALISVGSSLTHLLTPYFLDSGAGI